MSLEPMPDELRALIEAEPARLPPAGAEARLLERLDGSLLVAAAEVGAPAVSPRPGTGAPATGALGSVGLVKLPVLLGAGLFAAGVGSGALLHAKLAAPPPPPVTVSPAKESSVEVVREVAPVASAPETAPPGPARPVRRPAATPQPVTETTLEAERRLLEPARAALARGLTANALTLVATHERQFPDGALAEERDVLWVQALAQARELPEAKRRAVRFAARYPESLFLPVVEQATKDAVTDSGADDK